MPTDEVTDEQRGAEQPEWTRINPFAYGVNVGPEVYQGTADDTASEQRGYDRAIAEVVDKTEAAIAAWAMREVETSYTLYIGGEAGDIVRGIASGEWRRSDAIEAGEHKP